MSPTRYATNHARASKTGLILFTLSMKSVAYDSVPSEIIYTPKRGARVLHASPFSTCDTRLSSCHPYREGEPCIYYFVPNGRFLFRNSTLFSFGRGSFPVLNTSGPAAGRRGQHGTSVGSGRVPWPMLYMVEVTWPWLRPGSVAHALHGRSNVAQQATQEVALHFRKAIQGLENVLGPLYFVLQIFCFPIYMLLQLQQHTQQCCPSSCCSISCSRSTQQKNKQQQQAYDCGSREVLLECRWVLLLLLLLLLLSARLPVIDWPRRACVFLVLVGLDKSNDHVIVNPCSIFPRCNKPCLKIYTNMLVCSSAARAVRGSTVTTAGV